MKLLVDFPMPYTGGVQRLYTAMMVDTNGYPFAAQEYARASPAPAQPRIWV